MTKAEISRGLTLTIAALLTAFFGFASVASAQVATIVNTGPDSNNSISANTVSNCSVSNNNNVSANSITHQVATTGDATVSGNTNAGGWAAYDPAAWQAQGYSYAQWHSAVNSYMANLSSSWNAGSNSGSGGGAVSGDASNYNSNNVNFTISNGLAGSGAGNYCAGGIDLDGDGTIDTTGPGSNNAITSNTADHNALHNKNNVNVTGIAGQYAGSGDASTQNNTWSGGSGSGNAHNANKNGINGLISNGGGGFGSGSHSGGSGGSGVGGSSASISNTGPDSSNTITNKYNRSTSVTNNNNVSANSYTGQWSNSGSATTSNNTSAGGSGTGNASNNSSSSNSFNLSN